MRFSYTTACFLTVGSLRVVALPVRIKSLSSSTKVALKDPSLLSSQEWDWTRTESVAAPTPMTEPTLINIPPHPSVIALSASHSYIDVPTATNTPQAQVDQTYTPRKDKFGSVFTVLVCSIVAAVVVVIVIWAIIAHHNGRRPLACFGGCSGRKCKRGVARQGSMAPDITLNGAGRHYERRPVSMQPQPQSTPIPAHQHPKPTYHQIPRPPVAEPEWAHGF
jgi:hypothetical protein